VCTRTILRKVQFLGQKMVLLDLELESLNNFRYKSIHKVPQILHIQMP
jgi:hypothetical protein